MRPVNDERVSLYLPCRPSLHKHAPSPRLKPVALPDYLFTFLWGVLKTAQTVNVRPFNFFVKCKAQTEREIRLLVCGRDAGLGLELVLGSGGVA